MKILFLLLVAFTSCSQKPIEVRDPNLAEDSLAGGKVHVTAMKRIQDEDICFDIKLSIKDAEQKLVAPFNWTIAWIDQNSRYHLITLSQRDPASIPVMNERKERINYFQTCASKAKLGEVGSLVLTPKELPFTETEGLKLQWH